MKRLASLALLALLGTSAVALADDAMKSGSMKKDDKMKSSSMETCKGTITKMDKAGKMMMMKEANGKESTCYWDDSTKVTGEMKEGAPATVKCEMKDGKMMAKSVTMMSEKKMEDKKKM